MDWNNEDKDTTDTRNNVEMKKKKNNLQCEGRNFNKKYKMIYIFGLKALQLRTCTT